MDFQLGDQEHVENTKAIIGLMDDNCATGRRTREKVRMIDAKSSSVTHVERKGLERAGTMDEF